MVQIWIFVGLGREARRVVESLWGFLSIYVKANILGLKQGTCDIERRK